MEIELSRLTATERPVSGEVRIVDDSLRGGGIHFAEALRIDGSVRRVGEYYVVAGAIHGVVSLDCSRCLEAYRYPLELEFEARFAEQSAAPSPIGRSDTGDQEDDGIKLEEDELDVSFLPTGTTVLWVEEVVREQVLLELPLRPLCGDGCAGLCARCGANLNEGECGCPAHAEAKDLRLAVLDEWKKNLEGR